MAAQFAAASAPDSGGVDAWALSTGDAVERAGVARRGGNLENSCNKLKQEGKPWPCTRC
jgi:hypothetical protein